jgi:hypothetical protein
MVMMSPRPMIVPVVSPDHDRRRAIHHRRACHDHGRGVDDSRRWGSDHDRRRCYDHRKLESNRYPNPSMCREWQGKSCYS